MNRKSSRQFAGLVAWAFVFVALVVPFPVAVAQQAFQNEDILAKEGGDMFQLFMTGEQRRLLEAVRQGLLRDEQLDRVREINTARLQEFEEQNTETIELAEFISFDNPQLQEDKGRSIDLKFGGFIRIGDRNSSLLMNGKFVEADDLKSLGIDFNKFASEHQSSLIGVDSLREERIVLKPGQTLPRTGVIRENYVSIKPAAHTAAAVESQNQEESAGSIDIQEVISE